MAVKAYIVKFYIYDVRHKHKDSSPSFHSHPSEPARA